MKRVYIETLGCSKNLVDSEYILGDLLKKGYSLVDNPFLAEDIIINTCAFIRPAIDESLQFIFNYSKYKKIGNCKNLIVTGCLLKRYNSKLLAKLLPEVDRFINFAPTTNSERVLLSQQGVGYLKISEGCNNRCSYCTIPQIRGNLKSKSLDELLTETKFLLEQGVKEINIISQDTTAYGEDKNQQLLLPLLTKIVKFDGLKWLRLLYLNPAKINERLINFIKETEKIVPYFDIPIQNPNERILKKMNRAGNANYFYSLFNKIRKEIKDAVLRTTIMVGFPTETEKEFKFTLQFIKDIQFDKLGVFEYSDEEGTLASTFTPKVSKKEKTRRYKEIMAVQQKISSKILKTKIGKVLECIIEAKNDNIFYARTKYDAPEVDGMILLQSTKQHSIGDIVVAKITNSTDYDLYGVVIN